MKHLWVACVLVACATTPVPPSVSTARVEAADGARVSVYRWGRGAGAARVLLVPELGFDHRVVAPLAEVLRGAGFDVYAFDARRSAGGVAGYALDVAAALDASRAEYLVGMGVAGAIALRAVRVRPVKGALLINVPFSLEPTNVALADALAAYGFNPAAWARTQAGPMLLGAGRQTPEAAAHAFEKLSVPLEESLAADVARLYASKTQIDAPPIRMRLLVGTKDNLVEPRLSLSVRRVSSVTGARRIGKIEGFERDVGHLDWLVDPFTLRDVAPTIVRELEALQ